MSKGPKGSDKGIGRKGSVIRIPEEFLLERGKGGKGGKGGGDKNTNITTGGGGAPVSDVTPTPLTDFIWE